MRPHDRADDELRALAALHALGALEGEEAAAFARHLAEGCTACRTEVEAAAATARELVWAAPVAASSPPPGLRERLLGTARATRPEAVGYAFALRDEGRWIEVSPGVERRELDGGSGDRSRAYLVRIAPGGVVRTHVHAAVEHCLVVSGDFRVAGRTLYPGDYHRAAAGSVHDGLSSERGCVVLVVEAG